MDWLCSCGKMTTGSFLISTCAACSRDADAVKAAHAAWKKRVQRGHKGRK